MASGRKKVSPLDGYGENNLRFELTASLSPSPTPSVSHNAFLLSTQAFIRNQSVFWPGRILNTLCH